MRSRLLAAGLAGVAALVVGCSAGHGALPAPSAATESPAPDTGVAAEALLGSTDVPDGYQPSEVDPAERWGDVLNESENTVSLRPDCSAPLEAVSSRVAGVPDDAAGAAYADADGTEIVQFVAVLPEGVGAAITTELADLHSRCDSYTLPAPESGSLALSITPLDLVPPEAGDVTVTAWRRTLISSTLRAEETRVAYSAGDLAGLVAVSGPSDLDDDELARLVDAAIGKATEAE